MGSIIAQAAIAPLRVKGAAPGATGTAANPWQDNVMKIYAFFMLLGCFFTLLIPETKRITLEALAGEKEYTASEVTNGVGSTKRADLDENGDERVMNTP